MRLEVVREKIPLSAPFTITGYTFTDVDAVVVHVADGGATGSGEAAGVYYLDDGVEHMCAEIERVRADVEAGVDRESLRRLLPPGGARNAIDCALWDLESKRLGQPAWRIAGLERPRPLLTTFTIPAGDPASMAAKAVEYAQAKQLKLKRLFLLTTRTAQWFRERGFAEEGLESLPTERREFYNYQRRSKVLIKTL